MAFWIILALAVGIGGGRAVAGLPALASAILPPGVIAAQASDLPAPGSVSLRVSLGGIEPGRFAPQVLFPVVTHAFPDWLVGRGTGDLVQTGTPPAPPSGIKPKVAIVIDDLGPDLAHTDRALALPRAVTLSFLPYAEATPWLAAEAERDGHEVLVHMPMQATGAENPGPMALRGDLPPGEIRSRLAAALARVPAAIGINNHMGSAFTADQAALIPVAEELAARHLFFFDSRTTADSQVVRIAHAFGVASAERDVFLDDELTADAVGAQLMELEAKARAQGVAIAIGHPHDVTLTALASWTAHAAAHGFTLIPLSEAIRLKTEREARRSLASRR